MRERKRICKRCGTERFIPRVLAKEKAPGHLEMASAKINRAGMALTPVVGWFMLGRADRQVKELEEKRVKVAELAMCRNCGSSDYKEKRA